MSASATEKKPLINPRSKIFWLLLLFMLYSAFGWLAVPYIVKTQIKSNLESLAAWQSDIQKVVFNPYALSLELRQARIEDASGKPVLSFDRLFVNLSLFTSLGGSLAFDEISLEKPQVYLDLDNTGSTNFQRAFASENSVQDTEPTEPESGPVKLMFKRIRIDEGAIFFSDLSGDTPFELALSPLSLALEDFSTHHNEGGEYSLSASLNHAQRLEWTGKIGISPLQSSGRLSLSNIDASSFWHYVKDTSPYWLNKAKVSVSANYVISAQENDLQLTLDQAAINLDDLALADREGGTEWLTFKHLKVSPLSFDLKQLSLDLGHIALVEPKITLIRASDKSLNVLGPLASTETADQATEPLEPTASPEEHANNRHFKWQLQDIKLTDGVVDWQDNALTQAASLAIRPLNLETGPISDNLSQAFPFQIQFAIADTNTAANAEPAVLSSIQGQLSPVPFTLEGSADLSALPLAQLNNYLNDLSHVAIASGHADLKADYQISLEDALSGRIHSTLTVKQLGLIDTQLNKPLNGFQQLSIGPVEVLFQPATTAPNIRIEEVLLDDFYAELAVSETGELNVSQLLKTDSPPEAELPSSSEDATQPETLSESSSAGEFSLKRFKLNNTKIRYSDASLKPAFATQISALSGEINDLSSEVNAKSSVALTGKVDELGKLSINGTLNPLSESPNSHLLVRVNNVDMTIASPYSAKYAGYLIDKGKLELDLDYLINNSKIKAKNKVGLNQFTFGKSVDSPEATSLPLPLALGLLKDRKGDIDIDLPISGDLNDPSFKLSSVILNTFVNMITKIVTSPFSILGSLIEGADQLSEIHFVANSAALQEAQTQTLLKLAKALKQRPQLTLEIRAVADANIDRYPETNRSQTELLQLAKERAQTLSQLIIQQGEIDPARVFVLEPQIIPLVNPAPQLNTSSANSESTKKTENTETSPSPEKVASSFTLGVR